MMLAAAVALCHGSAVPCLRARLSAPRLCATSSVSSSVDSGFQLCTSYAAAVDLLLDEVAATEAGDEISLSLYLLESGRSSERVLDALEEAGTSRGVRVSFGLDVSYVSAISRLIEKTDTLIPRAEGMAAANPEWCECTYRSKPDHAKFVTFKRKGSERLSSAIMGGINLGDRFVDWDDYAVRLSGDDVCTIGDDDAIVSVGYSSSVAAAQTIAYASPVVALFTLLTTAAMAMTLAATPVTAVAGRAEVLGSLASVTALLAVVAAALGAAFATAADGGPFDLAYELQMFVRSLVYDRRYMHTCTACMHSRMHMHACMHAYIPSSRALPQRPWRRARTRATCLHRSARHRQRIIKHGGRGSRD